ncbi:MAG: hypothetical protein IJH37_01305 [Clostridia bacterium]|nr:hypothetical protein [Clostridia bacterium]
MEKKERKKSRIWYMALSLVLAVVIWILAAYINGNSTQLKIKNIPINYIGKSQLTEKELVIVADREQERDFSLTVTGKRDALARAMGKWVAAVDVSEINEPGEYDIDSNITPPNSGISVTEKSFDTVHVKIEKLVKKEIPVEIRSSEISGKLIKTESDRKNVIVSGAGSEVEEVSMAVAELDLSEAKGAEQSATLPLVPVDSMGSPVPPPSDTISLDSGQVTVICTIYDLTTLPVRADFSAVGDTSDINMEKTRISPASATVGVLPGTELQSVRAEVRSITGDEMECELIEEEGMYIPESSRFVKVKLTMNE